MRLQISLKFQNEYNTKQNCKQFYSFSSSVSQFAPSVRRFKAEMNGQYLSSYFTGNTVKTTQALRILPRAAHF